MDARQSAKIIGAQRTSRRTVLKRSTQLGAAITGVAATGGITSILASAKAPAFIQDSAPSGKVRFLVYGEAANNQPVFDSFNAVYPDIELEVVGIAGRFMGGFRRRRHHAYRRRRAVRCRPDRDRRATPVREPRDDRTDRRPDRTRCRGGRCLARRFPPKTGGMVQHPQLA